MREIVINDCFGGFGLSPLATKELAKRKGKECYFFEHDFKTKRYKSLTLKEAKKAFMFFTYTVTNPQDYKLDERDKDGLYGSANERGDKISLGFRDIDRHDKDLVVVVKKLNERANGKHAKLKIVKIPNNVEYVIEEYDGLEHIAEKHRTWD